MEQKYSSFIDSKDFLNSIISKKNRLTNYGIIFRNYDFDSMDKVMRNNMTKSFKIHYDETYGHLIVWTDLNHLKEMGYIKYLPYFDFSKI